MRSLEVYLTPPKKGAPVQLDLFSCIHIGHDCHLRDKTIELLDDVLNTPGRFLINLGDTFDNGTKQSPGASVYQQTMNPRDQLIVVASMFRPLVDAGKVMLWHDSNHSFRTFKETGMMTGEESLCRLFFGNGISKEDWKLIDKYADGEFEGQDKAKKARYLEQVMDKARPSVHGKVQWAGWQALTKVHVGPQTYLIHSMHGEGAGVAPSSALNAVLKQRDCGQADIYARGHHHKKIASDSNISVWDSSGQAKMKRIGFITTGCMLNYHDSYGEAKGYSPNAPGMSRIILYSDRWDFKLEI